MLLLVQAAWAMATFAHFAHTLRVEECPTTTAGVAPVIISACAKIHSQLSAELKTAKSANIVITFTFPPSTSNGKTVIPSSTGLLSASSTATHGAKGALGGTSTAKTKTKAPTSGTGASPTGASQSAAVTSAAAQSASAVAANGGSNNHYRDHVVIPAAVVGSAVGATLLALLLFCCLRRRRKNGDDKTSGEHGVGYEKGNGHIISGDSPPVLPPVQAAPAISAEYPRTSNTTTPPYHDSPPVAQNQYVLNSTSHGIGGPPYSESDAAVGLAAGAAIPAATIPAATGIAAYLKSGDEPARPYEVSGSPAVPSAVSYPSGPAASTALIDASAASSTPVSAGTGNGLSKGAIAGGTAAGAIIAAGTAAAASRSPGSGTSTPREAPGSPRVGATSPTQRAGAASPTPSDRSTGAPWESQPLRHFRRARGDSTRSSIGESSIKSAETVIPASNPASSAAAAAMAGSGVAGSRIPGPAPRYSSDSSTPNVASGTTYQPTPYQSSTETTNTSLAPATIAALAAPAAAATSSSGATREVPPPEPRETYQQSQGTHLAPSTYSSYTNTPQAHEPHALTPLAEQVEPETDTDTATSHYTTDYGGASHRESEASDDETLDGHDRNEHDEHRNVDYGLVMPGAWQPSANDLNAYTGEGAAGASRPESTFWLSSASEADSRYSGLSETRLSGLAGQNYSDLADGRYSGLSGTSIPAFSDEQLTHVNAPGQVLAGRYQPPGPAPDAPLSVPPVASLASDSSSYGAEPAAADNTSRPDTARSLDADADDEEEESSPRLAQLAQRLSIPTRPVGDGDGPSGVGIAE